MILVTIIAFHLPEWTRNLRVKTKMCWKGIINRIHAMFYLPMWMEYREGSDE